MLKWCFFNMKPQKQKHKTLGESRNVINKYKSSVCKFYRYLRPALMQKVHLLVVILTACFPSAMRKMRVVAVLGQVLKKS